MSFSEARVFGQPSTRQELYDRIRASSKEEVILEEMVRLGFWPRQGEIPQDPADEIRRRGELARELEALRTEASRLENLERMRKELRKKLRKKRLEESRRKRQETKERSLRERRERAYQWQLKKREDACFLGTGVSGGLGVKQSNTERLLKQGLPVFHSVSALAKACELEVGHLRFLTFHRRVSRISHYRRFTLPKKSGGERLISAPMPKLKWLQRWILQNILEKLEPHPASHGFRRERSIKSNALAHLGARVVVNADIKDFFPTITFRRVKGLFAALGYAEQVATLLALATTEPETREVVLDGITYYVHLGDRHLPQGAPTSPAITNLICRRLDARVAAMAQRLSFAYTRYADDFTFSSRETQPAVGELLGQLSRVLHQEGFTIHRAKTRVLHRGRRQEVTGLVLNSGKPTVPRQSLRRFRALLYQIEKDGPVGKRWGASKDVLASARGFASFVFMVDPDKGRPLLARVAALVAQHSDRMAAPIRRPQAPRDPLASRRAALFAPLKAPEPPPEPPPRPEPPPVSVRGQKAQQTHSPAPAAAVRAQAPMRRDLGATPGTGSTEWRPVAGVITKPEIWRRTVAKLVDLLCIGAIVWGFGSAIGSKPLAAIAAYVWFLLSDWFGSPGKALLGLKTVLASNGLACTVTASIKRNLPLVAVNFFWPIAELWLQLSRTEIREGMPTVGGFLPALVLAIWAVELGTANAHPRGQRLGDRWARTQVVRR